MNELDIVNFFPTYPNIVDTGDKLLDPYKDNFNDVIYHKKEFYDERLDVTEDLPKVGSGELLKHQRIIARFMSSHTPYNGLLLVHEMGTGKSCSAFAVTEQIRRETWKEPSVDELESVDLMRRKELYRERMDGVMFKGVMVIARGDNIINNLITELSEKCTAGQYIPEYNTEMERKIRTKKLMSSYYQFFTFETFAKYLSKLKDEFIVENFSNRIIIIDEAHNLRLHKDKNKKVGVKSVNIYNEFWRFLHLVKGSKVLLLSGTPMKDKPEEIASIMNLILDENKQLPVGKMFKKEYLDTVVPEVEVPDGFNKSKMEISLVKEDKKDKLKDYFKGHVSYLRSMVSSVKKVYVGKSIGKLKYFRVSEDNMSEYQTKYYREALSRDISLLGDKDNKSKENSGVYSFSRQAILFVYPGGLYGPEGFKKYVPEIKTTAKKKKRKLLPSFESEFKGTVEEKLAVLSKYSSKYAAVIENIIHNEGKSCFVYCEIVQGSGLILFKELLRVFGYGEATGSEKLKGKRCAILSSETTDANKIANILKLFNDPKNMKGEYIQVILGSKIIGEGISLKNVLNINILTPYWNYSETDQAIARGIRVGSHKNLIDSGVVDPVIDIYQRVSVPRDDILSIDLFKYELSENKDISIKSIDRLLKESAFDCALTYNRNVSTYEGLRECDYMDCDYKCDGVDILDEPKKLDTLTYNLYYLDKQRDIIVKKVREMFRDSFIIELSVIREKLPENSLFEIIMSIKLMIDESYEIINKYGFVGYLKEEKNVYFLVDSLIAEGNFLSEYYIEHPTVNDEKSFVNILEDILVESLPEMLKKLIDTEDMDEFTKSLYLFPVYVQQTLLEGAVESKNKGLKIDKRYNNFRDRILNVMKVYLVEIEENIISSLNKEILRCFDKITFKWGNCREEIKEKWSNIKQENEAEVGSNVYGYAGVVNDKNPENFCIRKLNEDVKDTRKISTGKMCKTWHISDLYPVMMNLGIKIPDDPEIKVGNKFKAISEMKTRQIYDQLKDAGDYDENNREEYIKKLYWKKVLKGDGMCKEIRKDMKNKNIILSGDCGTANKKKK